VKTWTHATALTLCQGAGHREPYWIQPDEPMLVLTLPGVARRRARCRSCADEPVPADIPREAPREHFVPGGFVKIAHVGAGALPFDYKAAQVREPGEDG
jgi:hypothetical protein